MSNQMLELMSQRRSIYAIGQNVELNQEELVNLIQATIKEAPSAFNSQTSRAVILFGEEKNKFWDIVLETLRPLTPEDAFENTKEKIASFDAGVGTILFYEDRSVVEQLQADFPLYADNFPIWSEHSSGIAQFAVWTALAAEKIGASLQHYNPIIDKEVAETYDIPSNWKLVAQMPFGSIEAPAGEKEYMNDSDRFKVIGEL